MCVATVVPENATARTPSTNIRPFGRATSVTDETPPDATTGEPTQPSDATSVEHNKAVSRRWIEVFNERDDAAEADVRTQDYVAYAPVSLEPAAAGLGGMDPVSCRLRRGLP
jgi:hypothetical protein